MSTTISLPSPSSLPSGSAAKAGENTTAAVKTAAKAAQNFTPIGSSQLGFRMLTARKRACQSIASRLPIDCRCVLSRRQGLDFSRADGQGNGRREATKAVSGEVEGGMTRLSMQELADKLGVDRSTISRALSED